MWIKTANARLIKTKGRIAVSAYQNTFVLLVGAENIATGTKEEMTAVLDRIARAFAAGLPFLDLGAPEEPENALSGWFTSLLNEWHSITLKVEPFACDKWVASLYVRGGDLAHQAEGPTPDAAIANLKPTGK